MNIALLISGGGTTAEAIVKSAQYGILKDLVYPQVVIASKEGIAGIEKVKKFNIPVVVIEREKYKSQIKFGEAILQVLEKHNVNFVSQNGWMPLTPKNVIECFEGKIINQHPGPLDPGFPDFGGAGMYGARVICARIIFCLLTEEKNPWTESVVHHVTEEFDKGELIRVVKVPLLLEQKKIALEELENDGNLQTLLIEQTKRVQQMLLPIEHENLIQALKEFAEGKSPIIKRSQRLVKEDQYELLNKAKQLAVKIFPNG